MNQNKAVGILFLLSAIAFVVAGWLAAQVTFYGVSGVFAVVGIIFMSKKSNNNNT